MATRRLDALDRAGSALGALLYRRDRFFGRSLDSPPLRDAVPATTVAVDELAPGLEHAVEVAGPAGSFSCAYLVHRWHGSGVPTVLYVHGSGEQPWRSATKTSGSTRRLFPDAAQPATNLVVLRAPFHHRSQRDYIRELGDLRHYVGMLASTTALLDALVHRLRDDGCPAVVAAGLSLGGWVVNLHRAYNGSTDRYVPMIAGARLHEVFTSSTYRLLTARSARAQPEVLAAALDFEEDFRADHTDNCHPLLARHDRLVELDTQRHAYAGMGLRVIDRGHFTGMAATAALRAHLDAAVAAALRHPVAERGGRGG